jgi:hypothetical protein
MKFKTNKLMFVINIIFFKTCKPHFSLREEKQVTERQHLERSQSAEYKDQQRNMTTNGTYHEERKEKKLPHTSTTSTTDLSHKA